MASGKELYCWGSTSHGQLGLGGIEDEQVDRWLSDISPLILLLYAIDFLTDPHTQSDTLDTGHRCTAGRLWTPTHSLSDRHWKSLRLREQRLLPAGPRSAHQKATYVAISYVIFIYRLVCPLSTNSTSSTYSPTTRATAVNRV